MNDNPNFVQRHARRIVAILFIVVTGWLSRLPQLPAEERASLAGGFRFKVFDLPVVGDRAPQTVRTLHPGLAHVQRWVSAVGASVALNDLDGDGLSNDLCYIDTRTDQVIVTPVPGTGPRYEPFVLDPAPLPFDRETMAPMGCRLGDFNEDGLIDVAVYFWGRTPIVYLQRSTQGVVLRGKRFAARELVPDLGIWNTNTATSADLDGDGHLDLIFGNYFPDDMEVLGRSATGPVEMNASMSRAQNGGLNRVLLFRSGTSGDEPTVTFDVISDAFPESTEHRWTLGVGAADLDGDLLPELYFASDFGPDALLHNRSTPGRLKFAVLEGEKTFTTPSSKVLGRDSFKGMGVDFGDINGDGIMDISVSNIADEFALEESHFAWISTGETARMAGGVAPYRDESEPLGISRGGWGWDTRFGDFNNDGVLELLQATGFLNGTDDRWPNLQEAAMGNDQLLKYPSMWFHCLDGADLSGHQVNAFFVRAADGRFHDLAGDVGLGMEQVSRGIATADVDGDGDLDFAVANQWETSRFFRNDCPTPGAFLGLRLLLPCVSNGSGVHVQAGHPVQVGHPVRAGLSSARSAPSHDATPAAPTSPARPAIGATAIVHLPDGRKLIGQVDGGNGHSGARSPELHFGLGDVGEFVEISVDLRWRDANGRVTRETITVTPGWHTVRLGAGG